MYDEYEVEDCGFLTEEEIAEMNKSIQELIEQGVL